jgi:hypothetical protein
VYSPFSWQLDIRAFDDQDKSSTSQGFFLLNFLNATNSVLQIEQAFINNGGFLASPLGSNANDDFLIKKQILQQLMIDIIDPFVFVTNAQPQAPDIVEINALTLYLCGILKSDPVCSLVSASESGRTGRNVLTAAGTAVSLMGTINLMNFIPPPQWNSKYPITRQSKVRFQLRQFGSSNSAVRDKNISFVIFPVNDPPSIRAPKNYTVQEDRPNPLIFPYPIAILDDADDVKGSEVDVIVSVCRAFLSDHQKRKSSLDCISGCQGWIISWY